MALGENETSILKSVKLLLGMEATNTDFDDTLVLDINSLFETLHQLGVGAKGYKISSEADLWTDYVSNVDDIPLVKNYVANKVRLMFDPPSNGTLMDSLKATVSEAEWRLNMDCDTAYKNYDS